ncbi:hypothetical protein BDF14DRAFT_284591 [Spinellus fusiger]|nr:hypothetical protein BDF14DRAFT_284591 [Spinellus fusiger]
MTVYHHPRRYCHMTALQTRECRITLYQTLSEICLRSDTKLKAWIRQINQKDPPNAVQNSFVSFPYTRSPIGNAKGIQSDRAHLPKETPPQCKMKSIHRLLLQKPPHKNPPLHSPTSGEVSRCMCFFSTKDTLPAQPSVKTILPFNHFSCPSSCLYSSQRLQTNVNDSNGKFKKKDDDPTLYPSMYAPTLKSRKPWSRTLGSSCSHEKLSFSAPVQSTSNHPRLTYLFRLLCFQSNI